MEEAAVPTVASRLQALDEVSSEDSERPRAETLSGFVHRPAGVGCACGPLAAELSRRHARGTRPGVAQRFRRTMAGFYACLNNQDDPTMAESLSEVSGSLEVLEANDEVKKKSKFKAFKNFFGKRKKKEPEGARGGRRLKPSLSSGSINISSLKPVREGQRAEARAKSSMGSKALSHDSIFMLDPEPEISVHRICPSPERQRGRPRQRSQASRTLPRSGTSDVHGGVSGLVFGAVPRYVPRSGIWIGGSKVAEFPSLRRRHSSSSPPLIRSHTTSAEFEETSVDEESPKIPQRKDLPIKIMSMRKSSFEPSPGPTHSQCMSTYALIASPSRTHLPMSLNSPASTCLDSSPARHKMALNPRKQRKRKNPQATGKAKREEPILLVASGEEKSTTKTRETDKWKSRRDGAGVSSLKHSKRTEMQDKKPVDKAAWASGAWGESRESAAQGKLRSKQGSSASGSTECAPRGRRFKPSSRGLVPSERAGSPPANKNARDCRLRNLSLERQVMEQPATRQAQRTPPQEPLPDGDGKRKRKAGIDLNTRKALVSQSVPEARAESVVWGPSPGREDGASGAEQPEARAPLSSGTESLSTASEDVIFSVAMEAQVFMDSSHLQSEGEEAFSFDLQTIKLKMESVQDIPAVCRERSPANILRAFTASISGPASARAEGGISAERLTPRSLSWVLRKPRAGDGSSDPESPSEEDSGPKQQLLPRGSLQSSGKPHDDQDVFTGSESSARELSSPERQLAARYSAGAFGSTEAEEASSDPESALVEEESGSEPQRAPSHPFQPLEEPDDDQEASDSESSSNSSGSDELLTPTSAAQALGEPEDQMFTESDGYVEKYDSAEEWSSADELGPPGPPSQASAKPTDQQQVASVSQILSAEWGVSVERLALSFSKPILPQQMSKGSARPPAPSSSPVEPTPTRQPVQPRQSPQAEPQTSAGPDSTAAQWDIPPEPLPARISSKHLGRPWVEQPVSKSPEISTAVGLFSAELLPPLPPRPHSHPLLEPITKQAFQEPVWVPAVEGSIRVELPPPRCPSQTVLRPVVKQQVCLGAESAGVDQNALVQPPQLPRLDSQSPTRPLVPQQAPDGPEMPATPAEPWSLQGLAQASVNPIAEPSVFSGLEATAAAAEKVISMEPLLPTYSAQALTNARGAQASEADGTCTEGASAELPPRDPSQPAVWPKVPPQPAPPEPVGASTPGAALVPGPASPRTVYRSWLSSSFEQQDSEREESAALEWGIALEPRAPLPPLPPRKTCQNPRRRAVKRADSRRSALTKTVVKQPAFLVPDGSLTQRSVSTDQLSSRMASQALTKAVVRQQVSAAPEKFATKRVASLEPWPSKKPSQSPGRYRVQQISYNFESVAAQTAMYVKPVASKYPTQFSSRSKVQEMSSRIENTVAERSAKKPPVSRHPSQSFVKFMAEKVFSESAANSLSTNQLSKSFLRSKVQYPVFLGPENASTEGAVSSKLLPLAHALQPLGRPEGPREVLPRSESVPTKPKQSSSKEQGPPRHLFMAPAKLEYQQVSSASQSSPEIWKSSEEPLPSRGPHQAKEGAELQPRLFLAGPASVPGDWNRSEEHQPRHRRYPCQVLTEPEYLPQVRRGSVSAAAVGATSESHPGSWSLSRGPASPNKTRKFRQVSEDLLKNTLLPDPKPMKFTTASTRQTSTVGGTYSKGEGLKSSDRNNSHPYESTGETGVETIFGVRLRKVPSLKKYKSEKQDDILKFSSLSLGPISSSTEQQIKRSFSQGLQGTAENPGTASDLAEKQQTKPQSESMAKKQPIYKVPGKALGQHSDCTASEPAWITMVKQKQKSSQVQIPKKETKTKNKAGAKPEAKEPRYEGAGLATENQSRKTFASDVNKLEKMAEKKLPKFTKAVGFKDQKIAQMPAMAKETRRSSTLPAVVQAPAEPEEPVWFSLAKEKAKAWTHISEVMQ
ncbi:acrosomal protein KIAA1210 homolog [Mustela nigripes]|uniref:acrosomal protein KIAA1210 homolog n=1 Tax=Mustela nigripes TaxID=77151 RepID=UPI00281557B4|nr:acrosomal protein KIAA1210 homolog [Mustela nigripes]